MSQDVARTEVGPNSRINGNIDATEDIVVYGQIEGSIRSTAAVVIEEGGLARADISAARVLVAGHLIGNINATERIEIAEKGRVLGDLFTPRLVIAAGGAVRGKIAMSAPPDAEQKPHQRSYSFKTPGQVTATKKAPVMTRRETRVRQDTDEQS